MSQECQQPQAHPARCGCEQKKPYPDRLCHIDYTAHPYLCGCLKGDAEAQRRFDEHQSRAPVPPAGGEPGAVEGLRQLVIGPYPDPDVEDAHDEYLDEHQSQALWLLRNAGRIEAHVTRLQAENAALQQRLTVADEQVDILSGGLRLMTSFGSGTNIAGVKTIAKQTLNRAAGVVSKTETATP
jgi:hypothetical protein